MSDQEPPQNDVKSEDPNATINIKVSEFFLTYFFVCRLKYIAFDQVVSSQGDEVFFKIKRSTKLSKLQGAYANKVGKDVSSIRYVP